jgi:hypothetical protein
MASVITTVKQLTTAMHNASDIYLCTLYSVVIVLDNIKTSSVTPCARHAHLSVQDFITLVLLSLDGVVKLNDNFTFYFNVLQLLHIDRTQFYLHVLYYSVYVYLISDVIRTLKLSFYFSELKSTSVEIF